MVFLFSLSLISALFFTVFFLLCALSFTCSSLSTLSGSFDHWLKLFLFQYKHLNLKFCWNDPFSCILPLLTFFVFMIIQFRVFYPIVMSLLINYLGECVFFCFCFVQCAVPLSNKLLPAYIAFYNARISILVPWYSFQVSSDIQITHDNTISYFRLNRFISYLKVLVY